MEENKDIIVIGASAGGIESVSKLLRTLPTNISAALFIVIHLPMDSNNEIILNLFQSNTEIPCKIPTDGETIQKGHIYLAPSNYHMMLKMDTILIKNGAKENHWRPAIDVLFRTAAAAYDSCVIGIILSGLLDDGTSGMTAIKRSGGICIVQEPLDAAFPDMPENVIHHVDVDYRVLIADMASVIAEIQSRRTCKVGEIPKDVKLESDITLRMNSDYNDMKVLGKPTSLTCPSCGGILTKIEEEGEVRYRCFTGHAFTQDILVTVQQSAVEDSLWVAIRMLEERRNLIMTMIKNERLNFSETTKNDRLERIEEIEKHIYRLKKLLTDIDTI